MMQPFDPNPKKEISIPKQESWPETKHLFEDESVKAVRAAIAAERPLLLRGEPGIGKSQLARAVATELKVPFLSMVIDERTERDDLFYRYDAVARLGKAQLLAVTQKAQKAQKTLEEFEGDQEIDFAKELSESAYTRPGVFWWAFNWDSAETQFRDYFNKVGVEVPIRPEGWSVENCQKNKCSSVILLDEIDKADSVVPNGLLECLGNKGFKTPHLGRTISLASEMPPPLVMITTNREREMPWAFLRRCFVHQMTLPTGSDGVEFLRKRARVHWTEEVISDQVCKDVALDLFNRRNDESEIWQPGAAEYLDILKVLVELAPGNQEQQEKEFRRCQDFVFEKLAK